MHNRRHKLPSTLIIVCIIALLGFKDTGIFVKDYIGIKEENLKFEKEEKINILKETKDSYIVEKKGKDYKVSKEYLIRTSRSGQKYKVIKNTNILDQSDKSIIRKLNLGEVIQVLKIESDYGIFETENGIKGYVDIKDLEDIIENSISYGIARANKLVKEGNSIYTLVKGETVAIKDFKEEVYIIVDDEGNEFKINENLIELRKIREKTTRTNTSVKSKSINKVMAKPSVYNDIENENFDFLGMVSGDLMFLNTSGRSIIQAGLYIGDNNMLNCIIKCDT